MHIPDGILPAAVCGAGYAAAAPVTWYSLRKINARESPRENIPKAAVLTAAFFVASLVHVPAGSASVHLVLNGLLGLILGCKRLPGEWAEPIRDTLRTGIHGSHEVRLAVMADRTIRTAGTLRGHGNG